MKRLISLTMCIFIAFAAGCGKSGGKYDYSVAEKNKPDSLINVAELQSQNPVAELTVEIDGVEGYLIETAEYTANKTSKSFFWLGKPSGRKPKGGWPAVLLIHGGGGNAYTEWVKFWTEAGYVALAIDIGGQKYNDNVYLVKNPEFYCNGSWGSVGCGTDEASFRRSWTYMNLAGCILANNYLRSLDYVNSSKIVVTGISWGGFLTCILSGLDKRFAAFAPVYGCGSLDTDVWGLTTAGLNGLDVEARAAWRAVYDPTAYLPYATKPMIFVSGMGDHAFSPVSHKRSTELIPGKVFYAYSQSLEHGHYWKTTPSVGKFFDHILNKTKPAVNFISADYADGKITVDAEDGFAARLVYTLSDGADSHNWRWSHLSVNLVKGLNTIDVPEGATAALLAGYAEEENYVSASSDIFFPIGTEGLC